MKRVEIQGLKLKKKSSEDKLLGVKNRRAIKHVALTEAVLENFNTSATNSTQKFFRALENS